MKVYREGYSTVQDAGLSVGSRGGAQCWVAKGMARYDQPHTGHVKTCVTQAHMSNEYVKIKNKKLKNHMAPHIIPRAP